MEHLSVTKAQECVLESVAMLGAESVKLEQSLAGAPVPEGADAVIRVEDTLAVSAEALSPNSLPQAGERDEVSLRELIVNAVQINRSAKPGHDVRARGESMSSGDVVLAAGTEITPGVFGVLATVKCAQVQVFRHPRVAI